MNFNLNFNIGARFKFHVYKASTAELVRESAWSQNLVLDVGLRHIQTAGSQPMLHVAVGTGNSTPVPTQVGLDNRIAASATVVGNSTGGRQVSVEPYYVWAKRTVRFAEGVAAGNLTEVGICNVAGSVYTFFNRALIRDMEGNPTTLTVLSDEYLEVTVELRNYFPASISGSFNLRNKTGQVISTHTYVGQPCLQSDPYTYRLMAVGFDYNQNNTSVHSGAMGNITTKPSMSTTISVLTSSSTRTGTAIEGSVTIALDQGNSAPHKTLFVPLCYFFDDSFSNGWQWTIDPPIVKNNTQQVIYRWVLSFSRYTGVME